MSGVEVALAASAAASAGGAIAGAAGQSAQARANQQGIALQRQQLALQREQLLVQRDSLALRGRDAENQRRSKAQMADQAVMAAAIGQGLDPGGGGTIEAIRTENARVTEADVGAIRLEAASGQLATTRQMQQTFLQDRSLVLQSAAWAQSARNAWVQAGFQVARSAAGAYRAGGGLTGMTGQAKGQE